MTKNMNTEFIPEEEFNEENLTNEQDLSDSDTEMNDNMSESDEANWQEKYEELNNSYLRLHAEFDNYRKRTIKEKADLIKSGGEKVLIDILPIADDFERALDNIDKAEDIEAIKKGIELIYTKFESFLSKNGIKEINTEGETFDLDKHEALTTIPATSAEQKDKIVECIQKGYTLGDKVIRYPKVIVAK